MYQRATTQECVFSARLFLQALITRVTTDYTVKARSNFFAPPFEKKDLTMVEMKTLLVRHGMLYTTHSNNWIDAAKRWYQRINQKKQNFAACIRENLIEVQSYPKKSQKYDKIAGLII